jgi:hypothetical protein
VCIIDKLQNARCNDNAKNNRTFLWSHSHAVFLMSAATNFPKHRLFALNKVFFVEWPPFPWVFCGMRPHLNEPFAVWQCVHHVGGVHTQQLCQSHQGGGGETIVTPLKPAICYFNAFHASLAAQYFHFNEINVVHYKQQIPQRLERFKTIQNFGSNVICT